MGYANAAQLGAYFVKTGAVVDAERLLERATELVQFHTFGRIEVPDDPAAVPADPAAPTDLENAQVACRKAACAQVEYWLEVGEDPSLRPNVQQYSRGRVSTGFGPGGLPELAPRAKQFLFLAGCLYAGAAIGNPGGMVSETFFG